MLELKAIFYARFHTERGPSVIEQYPAGSIATRASIDDEHGDDEEREKSLFDFSDISSYIIPPYDLCGKSLSVCVNGYRVLGWPVSLESESYPRNRFTFNVCFVLGHQEDSCREDDGQRSDGAREVGVRSWEQVVRKTAHFFTALEVEDSILATEEKKNEVEAHSGIVIKELLGKVYEQLNKYTEASIRINRTHTLNLRLSSLISKPHPQLPQTNAQINAWTVPLLIRPLPSQDEWTWDLTLSRIHPYLNGVNHIAKIAEKAEVEEKLVKRAIRGLVAHGRVTALDLFHYQAIYRLTENFEWFVKNQATLEEGGRYVSSSSSPSVSTSEKPADAAATMPPPPTTKYLLTLYTSLTSLPSVHDFVLASHGTLSTHRIDVRRLVTFGVLKGFLRRVHKYALAVAPSSTKVSGSLGGKIGSGSSGKRSGEDAAKEFDRQWRRAALSSGWATPPSFVSEGDSVDGAEVDGGAGGGSLGSGKLSSPEKRHEQVGRAEDGGETSAETERLKSFLDGKHCFDEICVAMRMSEKKVLERLRGGRGVFGEVVVFCK